ncbi:MAG: nitrogen regulation protein NR(II) [Terriglobales bacterium]
MLRRKRLRPLLRYLIALLISAVALAVVGTVQASVGFIPMLLLAAVAAAERYLGLGPAIITIVATTLGSLPFIARNPALNEPVHDFTKLLFFPVVAGSLIYLAESRRRERRVVQEQLLELSTLLESMPEAVFIFGRDGRVVDANRAAAELCGGTQEDLLGRYFAEIATQLAVQRDDKPVPPHEMAVARALRGETVRGEPRTLLRPQDRAPIHAVISTSAMRSPDGRIIGALLVLRDVTEVVQLQRRIADTERHLAIGQMASGIAHDFNNVLNTITQAVALLLMNPERTFAERRVYLEMIDRAARTGAEIIKRVREYIRGGTGEQGPVSVPDMLRQALDLTEPMWRKRPDIKVVVNVKPVPMVRANGPDLQRVFANLIINALQAMPEGGTLTVECDQRDGRVYARVSDTGVGISPEQQAKIFLPYFTTKPQGTGLGLSTAQRTVLAQGGNILFVSEPGKGTTFTVELPAMGTREPEKVAA